MTISALIHQYRSAPDKTVKREDPRHAAWWITRCGQEPVSVLTTARILGLVDRLGASGRSPSTVGYYLRFLRRVTAWAAAHGILSADPCAGMALPKERRLALRVLTEDEERKLCSSLGDPYAWWVRFAILTGLKQSEQFTLRWRDVDLEHASLFLPHPKTNGITSLPLSEEAVAILRQLRQIHPPSLWVFPDLQNPFRVVNVHAFYASRWVNALHRAGLSWCAWKDLRHTCGVRLAQQGLSVNEITRRLRQREVRQAYHYRAWRPDGPPKPAGPPHPRQPVFAAPHNAELHDVITRDHEAAPVTFGEAARLYACHHLGQRPSRLNFERIYMQFWQPWVDRPLNTLTKKDVLVWYLSLSATPTHANKALKFLCGLYNWTRKLEITTGPNPATGLPKYSSSSRARFLSVEELHRVMTGLPYLPLKQRAFLLVLLLTGARRSEVLRMRWVDVDVALRLWRKVLTKNGTPHFVPLPTQVMEVLQQLPRTSEWVFSGAKGRAWSAATVAKLWGILRRRWNLDDVTIHDLRRTCASYLAISGENLPTIQHVLNHHSLAPTSIYARLNIRAVDSALQGQADRFCALQTAPAQEGLHRTPIPHLIDANGQG